jgi:hypothetical protein
VKPFTEDVRANIDNELVDKSIDFMRRQKAAGKPSSPAAAGRAIDEYLAVLDDAAFGAATEVTPKFVSPSDPAAR